MRRIKYIFMVIFMGILLGSPFVNASGRNENNTNEESAMDEFSYKNSEFALLGGGCFWCIEAVYERIDGIISVVSGYAGGHTENPSYEEVCTGTTGHTEVVRIEYDPLIITYSQILDLFWKVHDPTTLNRQGADIGSQYRSIILYYNKEQQSLSEKSKQSAQKKFSNTIVTEIKPLDTFYPAEEYHQDYYEKNPNAGYCRVVIQPKLKKLGF